MRRAGRPPPKSGRGHVSRPGMNRKSASRPRRASYKHGGHATRPLRGGVPTIHRLRKPPPRAIFSSMNAILRHLLETAESWPEEDQKELVAYAREIEARRTGLYMLSDEERAAIEEGIAQADRGEFATDEEV